VKAPWYAMGLIAVVSVGRRVERGESAADATCWSTSDPLIPQKRGWHDYLADHGVQEGEAWQRAHPLRESAGTRDSAQATTAADR